MPVTAQTLTQAAVLRNTVGAEADNTTRTLTAAWVGAWDDLTGRWQNAAADITAQQAELQRYPYPWELSRIGSVQQALRATDQQLTVLGQQATTQITGAANNAINTTADREPGIIASQLPAALVAAAIVLYGSRLTPHTIETITARVGEQIAASTRPLAHGTYGLLQRTVLRGVPASTSAADTAARLVALVRAAFDSGNTRAVTIVRTETVDAGRNVSAAAHKVNQDVLRGWIWQCVCDQRSCIACYVMHGSEHAVSEPGPLGHQNCRCGRLSFLRPWRDLGIGMAEPLSVELDGRTRFDALPEADQLAILGPTRLELLRSNRIRWADLAVRRDNPNWRASYVPRPVGDLQRLAAQPV